jgi:hypothetical protein
LLLEQTKTLIARARAAASKPAGILTQVPFDTSPPAQDDLLCRTLVG